MPNRRKVIAGRVFLNRTDAESFAKKIPGDFKYTIENGTSGHILVCLKDYGDIDGTYKRCVASGITAFIWRQP